MKKKNFRALLVILMSFCIGAPVLAAPIGPAEIAVYNQQDWPVFIGYSFGKNMGFNATEYKKQNDTDGDSKEFGEGILTSPTYSGTDLFNLINGYGGVGKYADFTGVGLNPLIAIDLNQSNPNNPETASYWINSLDVYIDGNLAYQYCEKLFQQETGNGKSDFVVPGIDLTHASSLYFVLDFGNRSGTIGDNTSGPENFFLVNGSAPLAPIPEPATMLLLGSGLIGLAGIGRKKFIK